MLTQNIGSRWNLAFRGDAYDPFASNDTTKYIEFGGTKESRQYDQTWTASGAINYWWDSAVRLTLAYDYVVKDRNGMMKIRPNYSEVKDNKLTAQVQIRF